MFLFLRLLTVVLKAGVGSASVRLKRCRKSEMKRIRNTALLISAHSDSLKHLLCINTAMLTSWNLYSSIEKPLAISSQSIGGSLYCIGKDEY